MSQIQEIDVLKNWNLSIDHFYSIIKSSLGELAPNGKYQIQASAIPLDVSTEYEWFSRGMINRAFNAAIEPQPTSDSLGSGLQLRSKLSDEYRSFLSKALTLVETNELDEDVLERIDELEVEIENLGEKEERIQERLGEKWARYAELKKIDPGDLAEETHWVQGQPESFRLKEVRERRLLKLALQVGLRDQEYEDADHKEVLEAYKKLISPAATMRYPRFEDTAYPEEREKFGVVYFASKPAHDSNLFINEHMMTPALSIQTIASADFGQLSSGITSVSEASESITTDWSASLSVGYGPFKFKSQVSSHEQIEEEFAASNEMTISVDALMAIPYIADTWFTPSIFKNTLIRQNFNLFERWLGENGTLKIFPTHLVVCRGLSVTFKSEQEWQYDYEKDFKAGGSASASVFGIGFGGGGSYHKHVERQKVEARGHDLTFSDGPDNIRIIGYHTVINDALDDIMDSRIDVFDRAEAISDRHVESLKARGVMAND